MGDHPVLAIVTKHKALKMLPRTRHDLSHDTAKPDQVVHGFMIGVRHPDIAQAAHRTGDTVIGHQPLGLLAGILGGRGRSDAAAHVSIWRRESERSGGAEDRATNRLRKFTAEIPTPCASIAEHTGTCRTFFSSRSDDTAWRMQSQPRRSRMRRTRTGKRIELTARDLEIFRVMAHYRYLSSAYIYEFVGGASQTRFKERLGDLFHENYLDRPERQWEMTNCRHRPVIHELGVGAKRILDEHGIVEEPRTWLGAAVHRQFSHSLMICETLASIELGTRRCSDLRFIPWPEILAKAPAATRASVAPFRFPASTPSGGVMPDGLFGIEYTAGEKKTYRFFALEADRGTMPVERSDRNRTSYMGKIAAYREIIAHQIHKTHWGLPNLLILTLTTGAPRMTQMLTQLERQTGNGASFLFKSVDSSGLTTPAVRLLIEPWDRPGHAPLRINQ